MTAGCEGALSDPRAGAIEKKVVRSEIVNKLNINYYKLLLYWVEPSELGLHCTPLEKMHIHVLQIKNE